MTATSSRPSRLTSSLVRRPSRAVPVIALTVAVSTGRAYAGWRSGRLQQLLRVLARGLVVAIRAQHPDDLRDQLVAGDLLDRGERLSASDALLDPEVALRHRGDLRQVGDAEHLALGAELVQLLADGSSGVAADPRVDLVEDEGGRPAPRTLAGEGEHHPRELAAGGRIPQRRGGHPGVGGDLEGDALLAHRAEAVGMRLEAHLELRAAHRQLVELLRHPPGEAADGLGPDVAELRAQIRAAAGGLRELCLQLLGALPGSLDRLDLRAAAIRVPEHRLDRATVLAFQPVQ